MQRLPARRRRPYKPGFPVHTIGRQFEALQQQWPTRHHSLCVCEGELAALCGVCVRCSGAIVEAAHRAMTRPLPVNFTPNTAHIGRHTPRAHPGHEHCLPAPSPTCTFIFCTFISILFWIFKLELTSITKVLIALQHAPSYY